MKKLTRVERKMRRRRIIFRLFLLIFSISLLIIFALNSDLFVINNITVLGNNKLSKDMVVNASEIGTGTNIFKTNIKTGRRNLIGLSYVKEVKIKRKYPKNIVINIVERKPLLQIKRLSSYILLDVEGYALEILEKKQENIPLLFGIEVDNTYPGDNVFTGIMEEEIINFIREGHAVGLLSRISEINLEDNDNINIILIDGIPVAFGTLNNVKYKLNLLNEIIKDIEKKQISCKMIIMNKGENPIIEIYEEGG